MAECNLKKGDRIYECRYHEVTLVELVTDPEMLVQGSDSHYWHWKAKVIETNSGNVVSGEIVEYGISEESPQYGPKLFRKNMYEVGYENAEPILPPFDIDSNKDIEINVERQMSETQRKLVRFMLVRCGCHIRVLILRILLMKTGIIRILFFVDVPLYRKI